MKTFRIQKYTTTVTIPINNDTEDSPVLGLNNRESQLNGILKGITIDAPALTGTSYVLTILGQRGETLFTKSSVVEAVKTHIGIDANNHPLSIPLALQAVSPVRIKSTGTPDATGTLTFSNNGAILDGETVTIGDVVYTFKDTLTGAANEIKIEPDVKAQGLIDMGATGPSAGKPITMGATTYRSRAL